MDKPKKGGLLIAVMQGMKKKPGMSSEDQPEEGSDEEEAAESPEEEKSELDPGLLASADDLMSAIKDGDREAVARALKAAHDCCGDD